MTKKIIIGSFILSVVTITFILIGSFSLSIDFNNCPDCYEERRTVTFNTNGGTPISDVSFCIVMIPYGSTSGNTKSSYIWADDSPFCAGEYDGQDLMTTKVTTKSGYSFGGWYTDSELQNEVEVDYLYKLENGTIYARWIPNSCPQVTPGTMSRKLNYNTMGGDSISSQNICVGCAENTYGNFTTPSRGSFVFNGWSYTSHGDAIGTTSTNSIPVRGVYDSNGCLVGYKDITIYALWSDLYNSCPEYSEEPGVPIYYHLLYDDIVRDEVIEASKIWSKTSRRYLLTFDRPNYKLSGWYYDSELTKPAGKRDSRSTSTSYMVLAETLDIEGVYNSNYCLTSYKQVDLYAKWSEIECSSPLPDTRKFTFDTNGGEVLDEVVVDTFDDTLLPLPNREGFDFEGWYIDPGLMIKIEGEKYDDVDYVPLYTDGCVSSYFDTLLYAKWSEHNELCNLVQTNKNFKIIFQTNGGNTLSSISTNIDSVDSSYVSLPIPVKNGYEFAGWYTDSSLTNPISYGYRPTNITDLNGCVTGYNSITLYASWIKTVNVCDSVVVNNNYSINFVTNGGNSINSMTLVKGNTGMVNLPTPTKNGYKFNGWYTNSALTTPAPINFNPVAKKDNNGCTIGYDPITLYASWTALPQTCASVNVNNTYKVNFVINGGDSVPSMTLTKGNDKSYILPIPTKQGFIFNGWYLDSKLTIKGDGPYSPNEIKDKDGCVTGYESINLYAAWKQTGSSCKTITNPTRTLDFNTNGGNTIDSINVCIGCEASTYKSFPVPIKENYTFNGWYYDKELTKEVSNLLSLNIIPSTPLFDSNNCLTGYEKVTVYASWILNKTFTIKGILTDKDNNPLANYIVELHSDVISSTTNENGEYILNNIKEGNHNLIVKNNEGNIVSQTTLDIIYGATSDYSKNIIGYNASTLTENFNISIDDEKLNLSYVGTTYENKSIGNPKTGNKEYTVIILSVLLICVLGYYLTSSKRMFEQI